MNIKNIILKKNDNIVNELLFLTMFVLIGIMGRTILVGWNLQPFPNFEIIMVLTFVAAIFIRPAFAFLVPLIAMIGSDLLIGNPIFIGSQMNKIILFTYTGFLMISFISTIMKKQSKSKLNQLNGINIIKIVGMGVGFVLLYDLWTNFGWWYLMFPHTLGTLSAVYVAGIPFMIYHMLSAAFTFTFIVLPLSYFVFNKKNQPIETTFKAWERLPVIAITLLLLFLSFTGTAMQIPKETDIWLENSDETSISFTICGSNWEFHDNICVQGEITVLNALNTIINQHDISFESEYYETFQSTIINKIHIDSNGVDDKYWQFYVNGELSMVSCDTFMIENGDMVEWIFEPVLSLN